MWLLVQHVYWNAASTFTLYFLSKYKNTIQSSQVCVCVYNYSTSKAQKFISLEIGCCSQLIPLNRLFAQVEIFQRQGYSTQEKILPQRFCTEYT